MDNTTLQKQVKDTEKSLTNSALSDEGRAYLKGIKRALLWMLNGSEHDRLLDSRNCLSDH